MQIHAPYSAIGFDFYVHLHSMIFVAVIFRFPSQVLLVLVTAHQFTPSLYHIVRDDGES